MTVRQPTIPFTPRNLGSNLDLALLLLRAGLRGYLAAWMWCFVPCAVLIGALYQIHQWSLPQVVVLFFLAIGVLGALVASLTGLLVFGESPTLSRAYGHLGPLAWWYLIKRCGWSLLQLLGFCLFVLPGLILANHWAFRTEARVLRNIHSVLHSSRITQLLDKDSSRLTGYWMALLGHGLLLWGALLLTFDFTTTWLLGLPLLMGRLGLDPSYANDSGEISRATLRFLWSDPVVLAAELAVALFVFIYLRIAWFLHYVDLRVRDDCWDVELKLRQEVEQLRSGIAGRNDATTA
jgi:hypothetical protein